MRRMLPVLRRMMCNTVYDSQSGMRVQLSASRLALHELVAAADGDDVLSTELLAAGLATVQRPVPAHAALASDAVVEVLPSALLAGDDAAATASQGGATVSISLPCDDIDRAIELGESAAAACVAANAACRVNLIGAFNADLYDVQHVAAKVCDAGAAHIVLVDDGEAGPLNEFDVESLIEALIWVDLVGTPMKLRIGVRGVAGGEGVELAKLAVQLGVTRIDVCAAGNAAPKTADVVAALDALAAEGEHDVLPHGVDADALSAAARLL